MHASVEASVACVAPGYQKQARRVLVAPRWCAFGVGSGGIGDSEFNDCSWGVIACVQRRENKKEQGPSERGRA